MGERKAPQFGGVPIEHVGVRELRDHFSAYVQRAKDGEDILITEHGRPIARLSPLAGRSRIDGLIAAGIVAPAREPKGRLDWSATPTAEGWSLADIVIEEREADSDLHRDLGVREDPAD